MKKKILLTFVVIMLVVCTTLGLTSCGNEGDKKAPVLHAPTNVEYNGNTLTWDEVEAAEFYEIKIGNAEVQKSLVNQYQYVHKTNFAFDVEVTAVKGEEKMPITTTFTPISPVNRDTIMFDGSTGLITWEPVEQATGYCVKINGKILTQTIATASFNVKESGANYQNYNVEILPIVEGDKTFYSKWVSVPSIKVLEKPLNIEYIDGKIKWQTTNIQGKFLVLIESNGSSEALEQTVDGMQFEYKNANTNFKVSIKAVGKNANEMDSDYVSAEFNFLPQVTDLKVEDGTIKWTPLNIPNVDVQYKIKIDGEVQNRFYKSGECALESGKQINYSVLAYVKDNKDKHYFSNWSEPKIVNILDVPRFKWDATGNQTNNFRWFSDNSNISHRIQIYKLNSSIAGSEKEIILNEVIEGSNYGYTFNTPGTYYAKSQALAPVDSIYSTSKFTEPIKIIVLDSPENVTVTSSKTKLSDGITIEFTMDDNAKDCRLTQEQQTKVFTKNSGNSIKVTNIVENTNVDGINIQYKLYSVGNNVTTLPGGTVVLDSPEGAKIDIEVQATPKITVGEAINGTEFRWDGNGATGKKYCINIGNEIVEDINTTSYDLYNKIIGGEKKLSVSAQGNGSNKLCSTPSSQVIVYRYNVPEFVIDEEGTITISSNKLDTRNPDRYNLIYSDRGVQKEQLQEITTRCSIKEWISPKGTTIKVKAIATNKFENGVYYMDSKVQENGKTLTKLETPIFSSTNAISADGNMLKWDAPKNANKWTHSYSITTQNDALIGTVFTEEYDIEKCEKIISENGKMVINVQALGDGKTWINSDITQQPVYITRLETPQIEILEKPADGNGISEVGYTWKDVPNSNGYQISGKNNFVKKINLGQEKFFIPNSEIEKGNNIFEFKAIASNSGNNYEYYLNSKICTKQINTKQLAKPMFTYEVVENTDTTKSELGQIKINILSDMPSASAFTYDIDNINRKVNRKDYVYNIKNTGEYHISVQAMGGLKADGYYYLNSEKQKLDNQNSEAIVKVLPCPTENTIKYDIMNKRFRWINVTGVSKYEYEIIVNGKSIAKQETIGTETVSLDVNKGDEVEFKIRSVANNNSRYTINSKWVTKKVII